MKPIRMCGRLRGYCELLSKKWKTGKQVKEHVSILVEQLSFPTGLQLILIQLQAHLLLIALESDVSTAMVIIFQPRAQKLSVLRIEEIV